MGIRKLIPLTLNLSGLAGFLPFDVAVGGYYFRNLHSITTKI